MNLNTQTQILRTLHDQPGEQIAAWMRRAELQMNFARAFTAALPAYDTTGWQESIERAQTLLDNAETAPDLAGIIAAVQAAEAEMSAIGTEAKNYRIHCVGHGHIDMNWMWSWAETVAATHDTFASVLSLMEQYPELTFSQSQASVYALMERYYPDLFTQIQQRVKEGRWEVTAVHWVEGDKNLASAESLCRHLLYTRLYFQEKFGLSPEDVPVDWEPDTFGHANTIPGILAQGAAKYYYSCRQGGGFDHVRIGDRRPPLFYWQSPDGSRVLVNRESTWYNSYVNIGDNIALPMVNFVKETQLHDWLNIYGLGNHGGGPTRKEIDYLLSLREFPIYPQIVFGTATRYFQTVEQALADQGLTLPIIDHELNFEFTGCYTSQSLIKRANRFGENYLVEAETLAAISARLGGQTYPTELLREGWLGVLFNQFHDILPGSGVRETREHAQGLFQEVGAITGAIKRTAGKTLSGRIDTLSLLPDTFDGREERKLAEQGAANTPFVAGAGIGAMQSGYSQSNGGGRRFLPFVVYNPCAWTRSERVTVALYDTDFSPAKIVALDENGVAHPTMFLGKGSDWGHDKLNVAFDARDVPALGYRTYLLCEGAAQQPEALVSASANDWIETPYFKMRLDRYQCGITELIDKRTGAKFNGGYFPLGGWQYIVEQPRGMTSWAIGGEDDGQPLKAIGFAIHGVPRNQGTATPLEGDAIGYRAEWHLEVPGTQSTVRVQLMIHALEPRLDFTADIDWREIGDAKRGIPGLCVNIDLPMDIEQSRYETPFGSVERTLFKNEEVPTLRYAHVGGQTAYQSGIYAGATLLQDSKYGHCVDYARLRMRIVRSSFDPDHAPEVAKSTVRYAVVLHDTPPTPADLTRHGAGWNHPLIPIPANLQSGDAPAQDSFVRVLTPNVVLSALKQAEDGNGLIVRVVELNGEDTEAIVELNPALTAGLSNASQVDLMERTVEGAVSWENNTLKVKLPPLKFATVRIY